MFLHILTFSARSVHCLKDVEIKDKLNIKKRGGEPSREVSASEETFSFFWGVGKEEDGEELGVDFEGKL